MKFYNRISEICRNHKKVALFVDMDGTIVEYRVFPENFVTTETKEVFLNAEPLEVILKNLEKINEIDNLDVYILSLARSFIIVEEKKQWLKKYAPFIRKENYILLNKENGDYNAENREFIKSIKMMEKLNEYDYVIIDSPPTPSVWMVSALIASDYYLIPVKPDPISMTGIDLLQGIIRERSENYDTRSTLRKDAETFFSTNSRWKGQLYAKSILKRANIAKGQLNNQFIRDIDDSTLKADFSLIVKEFIRRTE